MQRRGAGAALLDRLAEGGDRLLPARLPQGDEPEEERRAGVRRTQLGHPAELAQRLVEHRGLVEGDPQVPVLVHPALIDPRRARGGGPHPAREAGGDQPEERLAHLELDQPAFLHHLAHVAGPVEQRHQRPLLRRELGRRLAEVGAIHREDQVERRDLLLDQAPLVYPAGALEEEVLRVDPHEEVLALRPHARLEVEGPRVPGEQVVHRLLDLHPDVALELVPRDGALLHQDLAQLLLPLPALPVHRLLQLPGR